MLLPLQTVDNFLQMVSKTEAKREAVAPTSELPIEAKQAARMILDGVAPDGLRVQGALSFANNSKLTHLPDYLSVDVLDVSGCVNLRELPSHLQVRRLNVSGCSSLQELPQGLHCYALEAREVLWTTLPDYLRVDGRLDLSGCVLLESLPQGLKTGSLLLTGCVALESLPENFEVSFLDLAGCSSLQSWPQNASVQVGRLNMAGCTLLRSLPSWLREVSQLNVSDCPLLFELPEGLKVSSWLDLAGTGITELPDSLRRAPLRWRGVPVEARVVFEPETITTNEVLSERNAELRRVLLERMGYERFLSETNAQVLDRDSDPGGERRLLRVPLENDEPLVCLAVYCPSTGRQYMLRVPPGMRKCRQAAAWIAGFDRAEDYQPIAET
jgi:hypothetical protein